jgi:hypothetical protein
MDASVAGAGSRVELEGIAGALMRAVVIYSSISLHKD